MRAPSSPRRQEAPRNAACVIGCRKAPHVSFVVRASARIFSPTARYGLKPALRTKARSSHGHRWRLEMVDVGAIAEVAERTIATTSDVGATGRAAPVLRAGARLDADAFSEVR